MDNWAESQLSNASYIVQEVNEQFDPVGETPAVDEVKQRK